MKIVRLARAVGEVHDTEVREIRRMAGRITSLSASHRTS